MSELDNFISSLSDHELAIFFGYRYDRFLENSKKKIDKEIGKRNLSSESLKSLIESKLFNEPTKENRSCSRCGSDRIFIETDYKEIPVTEFSSAEIAMDSYRCRLCGYNEDKKLPKNLFERINRIFKNIRTQRINKWNEI